MWKTVNMFRRIHRLERNRKMTDLNINASAADQSKTDESSRVEQVVNHGVINQNCGNRKGMTRGFATAMTIILSLIGDIAVASWLWYQLDRFKESSDAMHQQLEAQAKEGTIWLLRDDIIKSIDYHEATKTVSPRQYKRMNDQFEYYRGIGGNHDVKDRWTTFQTDVISGKVKMTQE